MNTKCRAPGCLGDSKLIKAHLVPDWAYRHLKDQFGTLETHDFGQTRKIVQSGEWDRNILCNTCESKLQSVDQNGYSIITELHQAIENTPRQNRFIPDAVEIPYDHIPKFDSEKLERFLLSVMWRCSVSNRPIVRDFTLYDAERIAGEIAMGASFTPGTFPFLIEHKYSDGLIDPSMFVWQPNNHNTPDGIQSVHVSILGLNFITILNKPFGNSSTRFNGDPRVHLAVIRQRFGLRNEYYRLSQSYYI